MIITEAWYERKVAGGFIRLRCFDCGGEIRFRDCQAGRERGAAMVAVHKPSGCCDERQATAQAGEAAA